LGQGSEFTVRLPVIEAVPRAARPATPPPLPRHSQAQRILVVDDNRDAADLLAEALGALGHCTRAVYDGLTALEVAPEFAPTHALIDIGLPVLDGYEVARRLRERHSSIVLIAVTGYGQEGDRRHAFAAGFLHHVVKPVEIGNLASIIESTIPAEIRVSG
jgi:CheY-like chemotaxis protein